MMMNAYYDENWSERPWSAADSIAAATEARQARYDSAMAEAMRGSDAFWNDIDTDAIVAAVRKAVHTLGLSPQERHLIVFRAVAEQAGRHAEFQADE